MNVFFFFSSRDFIRPILPRQSKYPPTIPTESFRFCSFVGQGLTTPAFMAYERKRYEWKLVVNSIRPVPRSYTFFLFNPMPRAFPLPSPPTFFLAAGHHRGSFLFRDFAFSVTFPGFSQELPPFAINTYSDGLGATFFNSRTLQNNSAINFCSLDVVLVLRLDHDFQKLLHYGTSFPHILQQNPVVPRLGPTPVDRLTKPHFDLAFYFHMSPSCIRRRGGLQSRKTSFFFQPPTLFKFQLV